MLGILLTFLCIAAVGVVVTMFGLITEQSYGSQLERYISSRNPVDASDVERYSAEYSRKSQQIYL
jgi:hypothetical protein